jgi:hypothetical protein
MVNNRGDMVALAIAIFEWISLCNFAEQSTVAPQRKNKEGRNLI